MSYLISRQAAISAICNACGKIDCDKMDKCEKLQLPSAQPEIIHCRECKHHRQDNHGLFYCSRKEYGYGWGLNDFCSDAERRTDE